MILKQFNKWERSRILGGYDALKRWENGEIVESIFNRARPKYRIVNAKDIIVSAMFSKVEKEAISIWTNDSSAIKKAMWGYAKNSDALKIANVLNQMFGKYKQMHAEYLYRGMSVPEDLYFAMGYDSIKVGDSYTPDDKAITSFSSSKRIAYEYCISGGDKYKVLLRIKPDKDCCVDISSVSTKKEEQEVLLKPNIWYNVERIKRVKDERGTIWLLMILKRK